MTRSIIHTQTLFTICSFIVLYLFSYQDTYAQETGDSIQFMDTVIENTSNYSNEDTIFYFDPFTETPSVQLRRIPDSFINNLRKDKDFWYAQTGPAKKKINKSTQNTQPYKMPFYLKPWFRLMLWIIIIGTFIAVVIWYLAVSNVSLFRNKPTALPKANSEDIGADIFTIDYEQEINKALSERNYRLTIRLFYLQTLKLLSERDIIQYRTEFTNSDYLVQLNGSSYYKDFFRLTRDFDYTWYGKFEVSETGFQNIRKDFTTFNNRLHHEKI